MEGDFQPCKFRCACSRSEGWSGFNMHSPVNTVLSPLAPEGPGSLSVLYRNPKHQEGCNPLHQLLNQTAVIICSQYGPINLSKSILGGV